MHNSTFYSLKTKRQVAMLYHKFCRSQQEISRSDMYIYAPSFYKSSYKVRHVSTHASVTRSWQLKWVLGKGTNKRLKQNWIYTAGHLHGQVTQRENIICLYSSELINTKGHAHVTWLSNECEYSSKEYCYSECCVCVCARARVICQLSKPVERFAQNL